jgi:hypothetical protein
MATCVLGEESKNKLETVKLPNNTVKSDIQDICQQISKKRSCRDLNPGLLFRCNFTNQQICQG